MKTTSVKCVAYSRDQVDHIMDSLNEAGISDDDISVMYSPWNPKADPIQDTKTPGGMAFGAGLGGFMGGMFSLLVAFGIVNLPGAKIVLGGNPLITVLGGTALGAALGCILGSLIELSLPDTNKNERIVLFIRALTHEEVSEIKIILREEGADHIQVHGDSPAFISEEPEHQHQQQFAGH